jgi:hypothetical protein
MLQRIQHRRKLTCATLALVLLAATSSSVRGGSTVNHGFYISQGGRNIVWWQDGIGWFLNERGNRIPARSGANPYSGSMPWYFNSNLPDGGGECHYSGSLSCFSFSSPDGLPSFTGRAGFSLAVSADCFGEDALRVLLPGASQVIAAGQDLVLNVKVASDLAVRYQWQHDGTHLPGQTNSLLIVPLVSPADTGRYRAVITTDPGDLVNTWFGPESNVQIATPLSLRLTAFSRPGNGSCREIGRYVVV